MKRVVAVCVIIALILAASTAALMHLLRVSDEMEASLSAIADAIDRDDMPRAARLTDEFHEQWERNETVMTRYIHHDELDTITGIVARLLIFDYYKDTPRGGKLADGVIDPAEISGRDVVVFASHSHGDHYSPEDIERVRKEDTCFATTAEVARLRHLISHIRDAEIPTLPNIF